MTAPGRRRDFTGSYQAIGEDVSLGTNVRLGSFVNLYGCQIGDDTTIGAFVEVQADASIGNRCKISSHTFVCSGVTIDDECFIGHGVSFINDRVPRAVNADGSIKSHGDWEPVETTVKRGASIGSGATIMGGIVIGARAMVGAGSVVTTDVPAGAMVVGVPARITGPAPDVASGGVGEPDEQLA